MAEITPQPVIIEEKIKVPVGIQIAAALILIPLGLGVSSLSIKLITSYSVTTLVVFLIQLAVFIAGWGILLMKRWLLWVVAAFEIVGTGVWLLLYALYSGSSYEPPETLRELAINFIVIAGLILGWFSMRHMHNPSKPTNPSPTNSADSANPATPANTHFFAWRVAVALIIGVLLGGA